MKKILKVLAMLLLIISLSGCASLLGITTYSANSRIAVVNTKISQDSKLVIYYDNKNYLERSLLEESVVSYLKANDVNAVSMSDYWLDKMGDKNFYLYDATYEMEGNYLVRINIDDYYTYELGDGISFISTHTDIIDPYFDRVYARIASSAHASENNGDSPVESSEQIYPALGESIATEILKIII